MEDIPGVISREDPELGLDLRVLNRVSLVGTGGSLACRNCYVYQSFRRCL